MMSKEQRINKVKIFTCPSSTFVAVRHSIKKPRKKSGRTLCEAVIAKISRVKDLRLVRSRPSFVVQLVFHAGVKIPIVRKCRRHRPIFSDEQLVNTFEQDNSDHTIDFKKGP